jgi:hypothetical protein
MAIAASCFSTKQLLAATAGVVFAIVGLFAANKSTFIS